MGRELVERAGLGPRASVSAAVARTGPQARARRSGRRTKNKAELPKAARGRNSANSVRVKFKSALLVHVAACEPNWATAIYAPLGQRTRRRGVASAHEPVRADDTATTYCSLATHVWRAGGGAET